ncbi:MAG: UDP-N-acetylmuramate--L-alanine ligase [Anaerolineae bacterium]|nr:UDP-N-acetylmuramate--L-alanine ligase [Anaerolineae bacterium]
MEHIHLIGIGGTGLSAIARLLLERGYRVSGSDRAASTFTDALIESGATVYIGHKAENISGADVVVRSSAVTEDNPEVVAARAASIPVYKRSEFLGKLLAGFTSMAVAGTHGKTTTTAMLAWALEGAGVSPSYIIGGISKNLGNNARAGKGFYFVIEADEYDGMFLGLNPDWAIVTNMEHDHPDCYPTPEEYTHAFSAFVARVKPNGGLFICGDESSLSVLPAYLPAAAKAFTYGLNSGNTYQAGAIKLDDNGNCHFSLLYKGEALVNISLPVPGEHNIRNALAVLGVCHQSGMDLNRVAAALAGFSGTGRRFDIAGTVGGITLIDDYGHHPTEIKATLQAARSRYGSRRIWAVWQPHTYSRTQTLFKNFIEAFSDADRVVVTEIYAAREASTGFSANQLVNAMSHTGKHFVPDLASAEAYLQENLQSGDVVLVLSAGDANLISAHLLEHFKQKEQQHV